jgi:hypothetical protein
VLVCEVRWETQARVEAELQAQPPSR